MHTLARKVRFSINPFLAEQVEGFNSYASKPPGQGLALFFEVLVEITGEVDESCGFVVNVLDIDEVVRQTVVPVFRQRIQRDFQQGRHVALSELATLLDHGAKQLKDNYHKAQSISLSLALNPFTKMKVDGGDSNMICFSEKFEFAAMHRLWNEGFTEERNLEVFGKCANPAGHGHNYVLEVTVKIPRGADEFRKADFERTVEQQLIRLVDHKNLNVDVPELGGAIPTIENLAEFAWSRLVGRLGLAKLHYVTVWETDKTCCSYSGQ